MNTRQGIAALLVVTAVAAGCNREEPAVPPAQMQAESVQELNSPMVVTGCLRAGDASNTFVLTTTQSDGTTPATYHLHGNAGVNLTDHVGERIQVSGVVREQTHIATRTAGQPAEEKAAGTAGTPMVQTGTELTIRQLNVMDVKRAVGECEPE